MERNSQENMDWSEQLEASPSIGREIVEEDIAIDHGLSSETEVVELYDVARVDLAETVAEHLEEATIIRDRFLDETEAIAGSLNTVAQPERNEIQSQLTDLRLEMNTRWKTHAEQLKAFARITIFATSSMIWAGSDTYSTDNQDQENVAEQESYGEMVDRASEELRTSGITSEQKEAYTPFISEALQEGIEPFLYDDLANKARDFLPNLFEGREKYYADIEDAWRLYLGMPQEHETFSISDHQPSRSEENKYYYSIDGFFERELVKKYGGDKQEMIREILAKIQSKEGFNDDVNQIMGNFTMGIGEDEKGPYISYYDNWNLDSAPVEGSEGVFGKPYEIYDRLHYDPETLGATFDEEKAQEIEEEWQANWTSKGKSERDELH